jgi:hypothetical protein
VGHRGISGLPTRRLVVPRVVPVVCFNMTKSYAHDSLHSLARYHASPPRRRSCIRRAEMAPCLPRALCTLALVAHASALVPLRAPLALGRRTALIRMALPASVMEFVPESVASDAAQMQQVEETWKVSASS